MADLIDRLSGQDNTRPKISPHGFCGVLELYSAGKVSQAEVVLNWDLQGAELTQAIALRNKIDEKTNASAKIAYVLDVIHIALLIEDDDDQIYHNPDGSVDKTRVILDLEI